MDDQLEQDTTEVLFSAVNDVLNLAEVEPRFVVHAMLVYEVIDTNGDPYTDYVVSNALTLTNAHGLARMVSARTMKELLASD